MKKITNNLLFSIGMLYIAITGLFNLYGYIHLPAKMATQFSISGEKTNTMPTPVYMIAVFAGMVVLTVLGLKSEREQKIKWFIISTIIFVANIVMIGIQI